MARVLIVGGGCRGRGLARELVAGGHAVRITTRSEDGRARIEREGAECWVGTPDRLATLRGSLDSVTVACWLLATAEGEPDELRALHTTRLEFFMTQAIDTTVRGVMYEAPEGTAAPEAVAEGARIAALMGERNMIPVSILRAPPSDARAWLTEARIAIDTLLGGVFG